MSLLQKLTLTCLLTVLYGAQSAFLAHTCCAGMTGSHICVWDDVIPRLANQEAENPAARSSKGEDDRGR